MLLNNTATHSAGAGLQKSELEEGLTRSHHFCKDDLHNVHWKSSSAARAHTGGAGIGWSW